MTGRSVGSHGRPRYVRQALSRELPASLVEQEPLPARHRDHPLRGIWKGYREAHIEPDWLVTYRVKGEELHLVRTGTHSNLFKE